MGNRTAIFKEYQSGYPRKGGGVHPLVRRSHSPLCSQNRSGEHIPFPKGQIIFSHRVRVSCPLPREAYEIG